MPSLIDIPRLPNSCYVSDVPWVYLEDHLTRLCNRWGKDNEHGGLDLDPDFQRGHVWTEQQQISYIEHQIVTNSEYANTIIFNSPDWMKSFKRVTVIMDGKQRLEAIRKFMRNELPIFGYTLLSYEDRQGLLSHYVRFRVLRIQNHKDVLKAYLGLNAGGTPHSDVEISRVRAMLEDLP